MSAASSSSPADSDSESNFECNICLCTPVDPVVTRCGHLSCWPCLFKWMSSGQPGAHDCPVCKAAISRETVIPIYGRGRSRRKEAGNTKRKEEEEEERKEKEATAAEAAAAAAAASSAAASSSSTSSSSSSSSFDPDSIPDRPSAQRPPPPPRSSSFWGSSSSSSSSSSRSSSASPGPGMPGGGFHFGPFGPTFSTGFGNVSFFTTGFGLVPTLLSLGFSLMNNPNAPPPPEGDEPPSLFGRIMLVCGILCIFALLYS